MELRLDYPAKDCETIRGQWKAFEATNGCGEFSKLKPQKVAGQLFVIIHGFWALLAFHSWGMLALLRRQN
jgi:hypothetical protein